jgi:hypothetical protein
VRSTATQFLRQFARPFAILGGANQTKGSECYGTGPI